MITTRSRQILHLNGSTLTADATIRSSAFRLPHGSGQDFDIEVAQFLEEWFSPSPTLRVHTSGSTGLPKQMEVSKEKMMNSACMTLRFLGLPPGSTALLAMPVRYIAGKMMVVRSLVGELHLTAVSPDGHPFAKVSDTFDFVALTPMQVFNTLLVPEEAIRLRACRHLIIGGGAVDDALRSRLADFPHAVWSTYGMTETLSHIALRRLNGPDASEWYYPLDGIRVGTSEEDTLYIDAPSLHEGRLITHDLVEWNGSGGFRIIGRKDNVINTGGIKVQIESLEEEIRRFCPFPFQVTAVPHPKWGEMIVLLVERLDETQKKRLENQLKTLSKYLQPKQILEVEALPLTGTQKPDRATARRMAAAQLGSPRQ